MTWRKRKLSTYSRYNVEVATTNIENSSLLQGKSKKGLAYSVAKKFSALVTLAMLVMVAFSGLVTTAPEAKAAWGVDNIMNDAHRAFCTSMPLGYVTEDRGMLAPKMPANKDNITAYEKYGMSGTSFTVWSGFNPESGKGGGMDENDKSGAGSTRGIITAIGGDADDAGLVPHWQDKFKNKEMNYPGMFNFSGECGGVSFRSMGSQGANLIFSFSKAVTWVSGFSYEAAADINSTIFKTMEKPVNKIVKTLKDKLYFTYLTPLIMIGALWMAYVGLVKRETTNVLSGLIWMIGAVAASVALMTNPMMLPKLVNDTVGGISSNTMGVITSSTGNGGSGELCYAPKQSKESKSTNSVRTVQCNLWYSFVYTPFSIGQFGEAPTKLTKEQDKTDNSIKKLRDTPNVFKKNDDTIFHALKSVGGNADTRFSTIKVGKRVINADEQNFALAWVDFKSNWNDDPKQKYNKVRSLVNITLNQLGNEKYNATFRGDNVSNRVTMALVALVSSLSSGAMIIVISVALIILDLGLIILALVFPLFALAALHPGEGRRIAMGWVELICKIALRRIVGSIYLATLILVFSVLVGAELAWAMSMILMIAIAAAGLVYYKKIDGAFSNFSLGGKQLDMPGAQAGQKIKDGAWNNAKALATGGRAGHSSLAGRALNDKRQNKMWEKRMGGAGNAPQPKNNANTPQGGAGGTPTRKELRDAQKNEARNRTLQGQNGAELEEGQNPNMGGAGDEPQRNHQEIDNTEQMPQPELHGREGNEEFDNNQVGAGGEPQERELEAPQAELQDREYDEDFDANQVGAGEEPQAREIVEQEQMPTAELPEGAEAEQAKAGAGNQPQSYREQLRAHGSYANSRIARKDAKFEKRKQSAINLGNKAGAQVAPIVGSATATAKAVVGDKVETGKFYAVNSVRELRDNLKNGVQGKVLVAKNKMGEVSEARKNKRIDKHHEMMKNSPVFKGRGFSRNESAQIINKQMAEAKARRERISDPIKKVASNVASNVGTKSSQIANAGVNVARVRASQGMEATRERLSQVADTAKQRTVVAYQESRAVAKLNKLNLADIKREQKEDKQAYRQERKNMVQDIKSQPRSIRSQYAEQTYGANSRGNALNSKAHASAQKYVPPVIRAQEARTQERALQEKQAQKEQRRNQQTPPVPPRPVENQAPPRPVNDRSNTQSAPRPVNDRSNTQSAPRPVNDRSNTQSAPRPVSDKSNTQSAPRPVNDRSNTQSAPRPVNDRSNTQSAPRPVSDKSNTQSAPRPVSDKSNTQSAPRPVNDRSNTQSAPRPVNDKSSTQSAPRPVNDRSNTQSAPRPVNDKSSTQSAPQRTNQPAPKSPVTPTSPAGSSKKIEPKPKAEPKVESKPKVGTNPVAGSPQRPSKDVNPKNQVNPSGNPTRRSEPAPKPPNAPLRSGKGTINKKK